MTDATRTAPSQEAGSTLPFDALVYQNILNAITVALMDRAPMRLINVAGTTQLTANTEGYASGNGLTQWKTNYFFWFISPNACTGPTSLSVDGLAAKNVRDRAASALVSGAWNAGDLVAVIHEGTYLRLLGSYDFAAALASGGMAPGFVSGFALATNTSDANNDIDVAAGFARSTDNTRDIILGAALTKRMDAVWAIGSNAGCILQSSNLTGTVTVATNTNVTGSGTSFLTAFTVGDVIQTAGGQARRIATITSDTAMTVESAWTSAESAVTFKRGGKARNSCYRIFAIRRDSDGSADIVVSTRDVPADLPAGWSQYQRIGYKLTDGSGNNRADDQFGSLTLLRTAITQINGGSYEGSVTESQTTPLPPGVRAVIYVKAIVAGSYTATVALFPAAQTSPAVAQLEISANESETAQLEVPLSASSTFKNECIGSGLALTVKLLGWIDDRGAGVGGISTNSGRINWSASISPSALTADTNDWSPSGLAAATVVRMSYNADGRLLTGLAAGAHGDIVELDNVGATYGVLKSESTSSTAANRFAFDGDVLHWPGQTIRLRYDGTSLRWRSTRADLALKQASWDDTNLHASTSYADAAARDAAAAGATAALVERRNWPLSPSLSLIAIPEIPPPSAVSFSRAGGAYCVGPNGDYRLMASNRIRHAYDPSTGAYLGWQIEGSKLNYIRNNSMTGAAAGTPGTVPTNWTMTPPGGLSSQIVGAGTQNGINYIDWRIYGTLAAAANGTILFDTATGIAAALAQVWANSAFIKLVGGSTTNVTLIALRFSERGSGGAVILSTNGADLQASLNAGTTLPLSSQRFNASLTTSATGITYITPELRITCNVGAIDITLRIGWPQMERDRSVPSSPIVTTNATVTRAADLFDVGTGNWFNAAGGAIFFRASTPYLAGQNEWIAGLDDGGSSNRAGIFSSTTNNLTNFVSVGGVNQASFSAGGAAVAAGVEFAAAFALEQNNFAASVNGGAIASDTSGSLPANVTTLRVGRLSTSLLPFFGFIRHVAVFGARPLDANLITFTS